MKQLMLTALMAVLVLLALLSAPAPAVADDEIKATLRGFEEVPAVSTVATGKFRGEITGGGSMIEFELSYSGLEAAVTAAHIHLGQRDVAGAVIAFLCGGGGKPACPQSGTVEGTVVAIDVTAMGAAQGIAAGELAELIRAIRRGVTYVNVHSTKFPTGEIRGQIKADDD